jgi:hypothetical protein
MQHLERDSRMLPFHLLAPDIGVPRARLLASVETGRVDRFYRSRLPPGRLPQLGSGRLTADEHTAPEMQEMQEIVCAPFYR